MGNLFSKITYKKFENNILEFRHSYLVEFEGEYYHLYLCETELILAKKKQIIKSFLYKDIYSWKSFSNIWSFITSNNKVYTVKTVYNLEISKNIFDITTNLSKRMKNGEILI